MRTVGHIAMLLSVVAVVSGAGCRESRSGMWRDQLIFAGDDGTVLLLGVQRFGRGELQVKGWFGRHDRWEASFYEQLTVAFSELRDLEGSLRAWSARPGVTARAWLEHADDRVELRLRAPDREVGLRAQGMVELGEFSDPEGRSRYRAGRGQLWSGDEVHDGWLLMESTPAEHPRRSFVDFGEFSFVAVAAPEQGALLLKRSVDRPGFDRAILLRAGKVVSSTKVKVTLAEQSLRLELPELGIAHTLQIRAQDESNGIRPQGARASYQTLLLGGPLAGIAVVIH